MNYEWRPVLGYEGLYEVSNSGEVRSLAFFRGGKRWPRLLMLAPRISTHGYPYVTLRLPKPGPGGTRHGKYQSVHRLVLDAFVGPCPAGMEAAHLNGNPDDCGLPNLRWVTHQENVDHQLAHGTRLAGEKNPSAKLNVDAVRLIRKLRCDGVAGRVIANAFRVSEQTVSDIYSARRWSSAS